MSKAALEQVAAGYLAGFDKGMIASFDSFRDLGIITMLEAYSSSMFGSQFPKLSSKLS